MLPAQSHRSEAPEYQDAQGASLGRLLSAARRQIWWVLACTVVVGAGSGWLTYRQPAVYEAYATLQLETEPTGARQAMLATDYPQAIETEIEILKSYGVAADVVRDLLLHVTTAPTNAVSRDSLALIVQMDSSVTPGTWTLARAGTSVIVTTPDGRQLSAPSDAPIHIAGITVQADAWPVAIPELRLVVDTVSGIAESLRGALRVSRPQANARIVKVSWESTNPVVARDVVNAVVRAYLARRNQTQKEQARLEVRFLQTQLTTISAQLREAEDAFESYRRQNMVIDPVTQTTDATRRYADLVAEREQTARNRRTLTNLLTRTDAAGRDGSSWTMLAATPMAASNATIGSLLQQLTTLDAEATRLAAWRTAADPDLRAVTQTRDSLAARLRSVAREELALLNTQAAQQDSAVAALSGALARAPATELQYSRLAREVQLTASMFTLLQTRLKEADIAEAVESANIQLVDAAQVPRTPIRPRRTMSAVFGILAGLLLGFVVALARELTDTVVRSRDEIAQITGLPTLASIPGQRRGLRQAFERTHSAATRIVARHDRMSSTAEAYRALRSIVTFSDTTREHALRSLLLTSAEPQDGKTTTAVNLAMVLAEQGLRVVLVDADHRRPTLHQVLGVPRKPGLADVLSGDATDEESRRAVELPKFAGGRLDFIPAGTPVPNPAEIAGSAAMRAFIGRLAGEYDLVLIDTPPLSQATDAAVMGTSADGVILVTRLDRTSREAMRRAAEELRAVGAPVLGTVVIDTRDERDRYGSRYHGYYGETAGTDAT